MIARRVGQETRCADCRTMLPTCALVVEVHRRLIFSGELGELRQAADTRVRVDTSRPAAAAAVLHQHGTGEPDIRSNGVVADPAGVSSETLVAALVEAGVPVRQFVVEQPDLEDVFVELTGEGFDVDQ